MGGFSGIAEAIGKLDKTAEQMDDLLAGIGRVVELLEEQNKLIKSGLVDG